MSACGEAGADIIHVGRHDGPLRPQHSLGIPSGGLTPQGHPRPGCQSDRSSSPELYIEDFIRAGGYRNLVHRKPQSSFGTGPLAMIANSGAEAGAGNQFRRRRWGCLSEVLDKVDTVLVMTVNPGFGGQKFIPQYLRGKFAS